MYIPAAIEEEIESRVEEFREELRSIVRQWSEDQLRLSPDQRRDRQSLVDSIRRHGKESLTVESAGRLEVE